MTQEAKDIIELRHPEGDRFVYNEAEGVSPSFEQGAFGSCAVALGSFHGNSYVDIPVDENTQSLLHYNAETNEYESITTFTVPNTSHKMELSFASLSPLTVTSIQSDVDYLNAHPEALIQMAKGDVSHTDLSFTVADMQECYQGTEGERGGDTLYALIGSTDLTIQNYQASCRSTYLNERIGVSNLPFNQDSNGMVVSNVDANTMTVDESGKYVDTGMKPNLDAMTITQVVSGNLVTGFTDILDSVDPFGDGSLVTKHQFDGDYTNLIVGEDDATAGVNTTFAECAFGQGVEVSAETGGEVRPGYIMTDSPFAWSLHIKEGTGSDVRFQTNKASLIDNYAGIYGIVDATRVSIGFGDNGGASSTSRKSYTTAMVIDMSVPHHLVLNYRAFDDFDLFLDGVELAMPYDSGTATNVVFYAAKGFLGKAAAAQTSGIFDQVEIYNRPLTLTEAQALKTQVKVDGYSQRTEKREHAWDDTLVQESYRIDDIEQSYTPARPSTTATLKCNNKPMIGYQDDITLHHDPLRILTEYTTIEQSQDLDDAYYSLHYALVDGEGNELVDGNGDVLYTKP